MENSHKDKEMFHAKRRCTARVMLLCLVGLIGCGSDDNGSEGLSYPEDTTRPTVVSTSPADNATNVALDTSVSVVFSEDIDLTTVNENTFTVKTAGGDPVAGTVSMYLSLDAYVFSPSDNLSELTEYSATLTRGLKDLVGNALAAEYHWRFTTGTAP